MNKNKLQKLFFDFATDAARTNDKKDIKYTGEIRHPPEQRGRRGSVGPGADRSCCSVASTADIRGWHADGSWGPPPPAEWPEFGLKGQTAKIFSPGRPNQTILHSRMNFNITFFAKSLHSLTEAIYW